MKLFLFLRVAVGFSVAKGSAIVHALLGCYPALSRVGSIVCYGRVPPLPSLV